MVTALYFGVLWLNFNYFYRTNFYFCTTTLLNTHKRINPSKLKEGRVRNAWTHVLKQYLSNLFAYFHQVRVDSIFCNRYVWLTWCPRGNFPDCGARGPGFDSRLWQGFSCLLVVVVVVVVDVVVVVIIFLLSKNTLFHEMLQFHLQC